MICFGRYAIAFLAVLTLSFSQTLAEEPEPVVPEPKATSPTTISIEDVAQQAVTVAAELEALVPSEGAQAEVQQIRDEINDLLNRVDVRLSIIQPAMAGAPKARSMDEWGKDLRRLLESLQALDQQLAGRLNQLSAALEQVTTTETQWEASRDGTVYAEASDAVRSRIDTTLRNIGLVSLALTGPREEILSLRDRLVEPIGVVSRTLRELDKRVKNRLDGILEPDRPRLWDEAVSQAVGKELREGGGGLGEGSHGPFHRLCRRKPKPNRLPGSVICGTCFRSSCTWLPRRRARRDFLDTLPSIERMIFLAELVGTIVFVVWLRNPSRIGGMTPEARRETLFRVVHNWTGLAVGLLTIAIIAEAMGRGDLADLIGGGTLKSAYSAVIIYALLIVLESLIAYALILRPLNLLNLVSRHRRLVRQQIETLLGWLAFAAWAYLTLRYFGLTAPIFDSLAQVLSARLTVGTAAISLGDILVLIITIWLTFALARLIDFVLNEDIFPRTRLPRGVPYAISTLTRYTLIVFGFMFALAAAGIELSKLTIVAGGLSVGIGFGMQNVFNNFVSGLILLFEQPLKVGDDIQVGGASGEIRHIGIRASRVRADDGFPACFPASAARRTADLERVKDVDLGVGKGAHSQGSSVAIGVRSCAERNQCGRAQDLSRTDILREGGLLRD